MEKFIYDLTCWNNVAESRTLLTVFTFYAHDRRTGVTSLPKGMTPSVYTPVILQQPLKEFLYFIVFSKINLSCDINFCFDQAVLTTSLLEDALPILGTCVRTPAPGVLGSYHNLFTYAS